MNMKRRKITKSEHPLILRRRINGETLQAIAEDYGVSRERIRQIVAKYNPHVSDYLSQKRAAERRAEEEREQTERLLSRMREALDNDHKCQVCGGWILRGLSYRNCSPECSQAWGVLRSVDNPREHRFYMAQTVLKRPEKYSEAQIKWATKVLAGEKPEITRSFVVAGSWRSEMIRKYRPERWKELMGDRAELVHRDNPDLWEEMMGEDEE